MVNAEKDQMEQMFFALHGCQERLIQLCRQQPKGWGGYNVCIASAWNMAFSFRCCCVASVHL